MPDDLPKNIEDSIKSTVKRQCPSLSDDNVDKALTEQKQVLVNSDVVVYCKSCSEVFYFGFKNSGLLFGKEFFDFKLLAFRHVWDSKHTVMVASEYFKQGSPNVNFLSRLLPMFDKSGELNYSLSVERLRERLTLQGSVKIGRCFDDNWGVKDKCVCSVCRKEFSDPKEACYCCFGLKPWMPYAIVDSIRVFGK